MEFYRGFHFTTKCVLAFNWMFGTRLATLHSLNDIESKPLECVTVSSAHA